MRAGYNAQIPSTSRVITAFTGIFGLTLLGLTSGLVETVGTATAAGIFFALAGIVDVPNRPIRNVVAGSIYVLGICTIGAAMGLGLQASSGGSSSFFSETLIFLLVMIVAVSAVAYSLTVLTTGSDIGQTTRLLCVNGSSLVVLPFLLFVVGLLVYRILVGPLLGVDTVFSPILVPETPALGLVTLLVLLSFAAGGLALAVKRLPIQIITSRASQPAIMTRLNRLRYWLLRLSISTLVAGIMAFLLLPSLWESLVETLPSSIVTGLVTVAMDSVVRFSLLIVTGSALLFVTAVGVLRQIRPESTQRIQRLLAYGAAVFVAVGAVAIVGADRTVDMFIMDLGTSENISEIRGNFGSLPLLVGVFIIVAIIPTTLFVSGSLFGVLGILTPITAGPVVGAVGLVTAAIAAGRVGSFTVAHVLVAGLAFILWDIGTYGHQLNFELGHGGRRVELVHAGAVVAVAIAGLLGFYIIQWMISTLSLQGSPATAIITLIGMILIFAVTRI